MGLLANLDRHLRRHAGQETAGRIVDLHHRIICHDILDRRRIDPDLQDRPCEDDVRESGHRDLGGFTLSKTADVRLVHGGVHLHVSEVCRDGEEGRRLQGCSHSLADADIARHDDPVKGTQDHGLRQVVQRLCQLASYDCNLRLGNPHLRLRGQIVLPGGFRCGPLRVHLVLVDQALGKKGFVPLHGQGCQIELGLHLAHIHLGAVRIRLRQLEVRPGGVHVCLVGGRVEVCQDLAFSHLGVEIDIERPDGPGDFTSYRHLRHGIDNARLTDRCRNIRIGDGPRDIMNAVSPREQRAQEKESSERCHKGRTDDHYYFSSCLHSLSLQSPMTLLRFSTASR